LDIRPGAIVLLENLAAVRVHEPEATKRLIRCRRVDAVDIYQRVAIFQVAMRGGDVERDAPGKLLRESHDDFVDVRIVDVRVELLSRDLRRGGRPPDRGLEPAGAGCVVLVRQGRSDG